jgi:ABC-2 type transport system permease protein
VSRSATVPPPVVPASPPAPLREVHGPSALGGSAARFWHLTWLIASTEYRLTYFGSALGYLWALMRPLLMFVVLLIVFTQVFDVGGTVTDYPSVLLVNIVTFSFFQEATNTAVQSVLQRESLVRKMHFPRMVIPLSVVATALLNYVLSLVAVVVLLLVLGTDPRWTWLLAPAAILPILALATGLAMLLSALYVRFRDVAPIWAVLSMLLFYGTPVLYVIDLVPESFQRLVMCNPIAVCLEQLRVWVVDADAPGAVSVLGGAAWLLVPLAILLAVCAAGFLVFDREAPQIAERL